MIARLAGIPLALALALAPAAAADELRGVVRGPSGGPVVGADFDVFDMDGVKLPVSDNTDATGAYRLTLDPGRYDFLCQPSIASGLAPRAVHGLLVAGAGTLDWTLGPSVRVIGRVVNTAGAPVAGADLDFDRASDGARQPALGDVTSLFGTFAAYVEPGTYHVTFMPPEGSSLAPVRLADRTVSPTDTLAVTLVNASFLSGTVRDGAGLPIGGARLVFDGAGTGLRTPASGNRSAADGKFRCGVAPGAYRLTIEPPAGARLVARREENLDLAADLARDFALETGVVVTGRVLSRDGLPVAGADWDVADEASGTSVATPGDNTDFDGRYRLVLAPGRYRMVLTPPAGSGLDTLTFRNVAVTADTIANVDYAAIGGGTLGALLRIAPVGSPTHQSALLRLLLPAAGRVRVEVFDVSGRLARIVFDGDLPAGNHELPWDGMRTHGARAHAGVYFIRARTGAEQALGRVVILP